MFIITYRYAGQRGIASVTVVARDSVEAECAAYERVPGYPEILQIQRVY